MEWKSEELSGNRVFECCTSINTYAYIITIAYIYVDGNSTDLGLCCFVLSIRAYWTVQLLAFQQSIPPLLRQPAWAVKYSLLT